MSAPKFVPSTVYVTYIASTPEKVWEALTRAEFTRQYFFGHSIELEPKTGGSFILRAPDGSVHMRGRVIEYDPPRRLATTWSVEGVEAFRGGVQVPVEPVVLARQPDLVVALPAPARGGGRCALDGRMARQVVPRRDRA